MTTEHISDQQLEEVLNFQCSRLEQMFSEGTPEDGELTKSMGQIDEYLDVLWRRRKEHGSLQELLTGTLVRVTTLFEDYHRKQMGAGSSDDSPVDAY